MSAQNGEILVTFTMRYDRAKADEYNESMYSGPEFNDPVIGDGESLVLDVLADFFANGDCGSMPIEEAFRSAELVVNDRPPVPIKAKRW